MSFLKFLISKKFLIHIGLAIGLFIILSIATFITLNIYTNHGENYPTPDFSGLTEMQFKDLIIQKHFRYNIIDSVHINSITPGVVIDQTPKAGSPIKENRTIFFTINAYTAEQVPMPKLDELSLRNAQATLESYGLRVGQLIYIPSEYTQLILGQHYKGKPIEPGTLIAKGSTIDLLVGQGLSDKKTVVPNLIGLSHLEALKLCQANSLNIDVVIYDDTIQTQADSLSAFVYKQLPDVNELNMIHLGASIDIWVTIDSSKIMPDTISVNTPVPTSSVPSEEE